MHRRMLRALVRLGSGLLARSLHPDARELEAGAVGGLQSLRGHSWCLLLTRRRDGTPVPTPLAFALDGDRLLLRTAADSAKVRRLRRDPSVVVAPCDLRGKPLGPGLAAGGRLLSSPAERAAAERAITARYGLAGGLWSRLVRAAGLEAAYLEVREISP